MSLNDELFMPFSISSRGEASDLQINKLNLLSILHQAAGLNSRELIIAILTKYPESYKELGGCKLIHFKDSFFGNTPLMHAIANTKIDEALMLLDEDIVTDATDMLQQINAVDLDGKTPLMLAIAKGSSHLCDLFGGHHQSLIIERLLALSADVNIQNIDGQTALHYAAAHRDLALMERLISAGARLDLSDKYGNKPLDMMHCTQEQADSFLAASTGKVFTRENIRWRDDAAFVTEFTQRDMIHPPWNITPKKPYIIAQPFVREVTDHAAKEREKGIMSQKKERALTRALSVFHDYIPRPTGFTL
jgi:hypothetical protein